MTGGFSQRKYLTIRLGGGMNSGSCRMCKESLVDEEPACGGCDVGLTHYLRCSATSALRRWGLIPALGGQGTGRITLPSPGNSC